MSEFDYVIVGAGSAGCVLAARLSEDPDVKVLLIEAGPPDTNENIHVPLGYLQLARTAVDWDFDSAPEPECFGERDLAIARNVVQILCDLSSIERSLTFVRDDAVTTHYLTRTLCDRSTPVRSSLA